MKKIIYSAPLVVLYAYWNFGPVYGSIYLAIFVIIGIVVYRKAKRFQELKFYGNMIEDFFVLSNHPTDQREIDIPILQKYYVAVDFTKVRSTVEEVEEKLMKSGNKFFTDDQLDNTKRIHVIPIIFQDGEFVNETWTEYCERAKEEIMSRRSKRHKHLKAASIEWYGTNFQNQE